MSMINVFLNNGREFQEVCIDAALSVKVLIDESPEFNGAVVLACLDLNNREVARFKWSEVSGYAAGRVEAPR
jgi:hypothetical protein